MTTRCIRVTAYTATTINEGTMNKRTIINDFLVYLDTEEIEAISMPRASVGGYKVHMKSGRDWSVGEDDFNRIEKALQTRT